MAIRSVSIPWAFLHDTVPTITNLDELQVCLTVFRLLAESGSEEAPIAERTIMRDTALRTTMRQSHAASEIDDAIFDALEIAVGRGTLLRFVTRAGDTDTGWYYANTPITRALLEAMLRNSVNAPRVVWDGDTAPHVSADPPNAFRVYEQNIGPLTPIIADQINQAAMDYPAGWIEDAIAEAVFYNKRNWRYINRILENWRQDGRPQDS